MTVATRVHGPGRGAPTVSQPAPAAPALPGPRALADLQPGDEARLASPGPAPGSRLHDLGFVPGTAIRMLRRAPLGDPVELELRGYRICLRARDLERLRVEPFEREG